jgi:hypothetical protein
MARKRDGARRNASPTKPAIIKIGEHVIRIYRESRGKVRIVAPPDVIVVRNGYFAASSFDRGGLNT